MKVALLGATGLIGSALLKEALDRGHIVTAIVRHPEKLEKRAGLTAKAGDVLRHDFSCDADSGMERILFKPYGARGCAGAPVNRARGIRELHLRIRRPLVRSVLELDRLRNRLRPRFESRRRWWRRGEVDKRNALHRELVLAFIFPNAVPRPALPYRERRVRRVLDHGLPIVERQQRLKRSSNGCPRAVIQLHGHYPGSDDLMFPARGCRSAPACRQRQNRGCRHRQQGLPDSPVHFRVPPEDSLFVAWSSYASAVLLCFRATRRVSSKADRKVEASPGTAQ
jgi:NAD(P)H-binding